MTKPESGDPAPSPRHATKLQYRLGADFRWGKSEFCAPLRAAAEGPTIIIIYVTIKSWTLSGNPQRYTEPPRPSAELCTVPFLQNWGQDIFWAAIRTVDANHRVNCEPHDLWEVF